MCCCQPVRPMRLCFLRGVFIGISLLGGYGKYLKGCSVRSEGGSLSRAYLRGTFHQGNILVLSEHSGVCGVDDYKEKAYLQAYEDMRLVRPCLVELKPYANGIAILVFRGQMISINKMTLKPNILRHPKRVLSYKIQYFFSRFVCIRLG